MTAADSSAADFGGPPNETCRFGRRWWFENYITHRGKGKDGKDGTSEGRVGHASEEILVVGKGNTVFNLINAQ